MKKKKICYIDLDGVCADFDGDIRRHCPEFDIVYLDEKSRGDKVDSICQADVNIFEHLDVIAGAIDTIKFLSEYFEIYFFIYTNVVGS